MRRSAFRRHLAAACRASVLVAAIAGVCACAEELPPPAPPPATAPAAAAVPVAAEGACAKDTDCKGDRICDHGSCVAPH